jgi:hypothetical protein
MRKHGKIDSNQKSIVMALRMIPGTTVLSMAALGNGAPDLLVGYDYKNYLFEIKQNSNSNITPMEMRFAIDWRGQLSIAYCLEDILKVIGLTGRS